MDETLLNGTEESSDASESFLKTTSNLRRDRSQEPMIFLGKPRAKETEGRGVLNRQANRDPSMDENLNGGISSIDTSQIFKTSSKMKKSGSHELIRPGKARPKETEDKASLNWQAYSKNSLDKKLLSDRNKRSKLRKSGSQELIFVGTEKSSGMEDRSALNGQANNKHSFEKKPLRRTASIDTPHGFRMSSKLRRSGSHELIRRGKASPNEKLDRGALNWQTNSKHSFEKKPLRRTASIDTPDGFRTISKMRRSGSHELIRRGKARPKDEDRGTLNWQANSKHSFEKKPLRRTASIDTPDGFRTISKLRKSGSRELIRPGKASPNEKLDRGALNWQTNSDHLPRSQTSEHPQRPRSDRSLLDLGSKGGHQLMSPLGKKVLLKNNLRRLEQHNSRGSLLDPRQRLPDLSLDPSDESVEPTAGNAKSAILERLPTHIKEQLSEEQWQTILEPKKFRESTASIFGRQLPSPTHTKSDKVYDALYCTEEPGSKTQYIRDRPRAEESKNEKEIENVGSKRSNQHSVSFGRSVSIRRYERILVVHPCTSEGPSLGIGWNYIQLSEPIDWIQSRGGDLRLSRELRERMVKELGYSTKEVASAVRAGLKIKNQRRRTINNLKANLMNVEKVEYMAEKCQRTLGKLKSQFLISPTM
ncbi:unnamed protein product [Cylindrotheca closterium]|uniref:Uncharacterized protein n=1 Tax=Cylindrotheca closterium TaxID=2856 RepID=A0AAD2CI23_9STRA|nr:unnamed protein product [Cylindrotheca closterium]